MAKGRSQFTGTAGQFFVAYGLTVREIHASQTRRLTKYIT